MKTLYEKILVNIDPELYILEKYYYKVWDPTVVVKFLPNKRFPATMKDLDNAQDKINQISLTPKYPWLCVSNLKDCIIGNIYKEKLDLCTPLMYRLFEKNGSLPDGGHQFVSNIWEGDYSFFRSDLLEQLTRDELSSFMLCVKSAVETVTSYTNRFPNNVFDLDVETNHIFIENLGEIGSYRYFEYMGRRR